MSASLTPLFSQSWQDRRRRSRKPLRKWKRRIIVAQFGERYTFWCHVLLNQNMRLVFVFKITVHARMCSNTFVHTYDSNLKPCVIFLCLSFIINSIIYESLNASCLCRIRFTRGKKKKKGKNLALMKWSQTHCHSCATESRTVIDIR